MRLKIKDYVHYDDDLPSWVKEVKTDKCDIVFEKWDIHRANIVLPSGKIYVMFDGFKCKNWSGVSEALNAHNTYYDEERPYSVRKFNALYTEFLYPGGPPLGYTLAIDYIDPMPKDEFKEMIRDWDDDKPTYREYKKAVNYINNVLYEAGKIIRKLAQDYEEEIIEEMRREEEEMVAANA